MLLPQSIWIEILLNHVKKPCIEFRYDFSELDIEGTVVANIKDSTRMALKAGLAEAEKYEIDFSLNLWNFNWLMKDLEGEEIELISNHIFKRLNIFVSSYIVLLHKYFINREGILFFQSDAPKDWLGYLISRLQFSQFSISEW